MKKVLLAGLVAFALVAVGGTASAWYVDLEGEFWDAAVDVSLAVDGTHEEEVYIMTTAVGGIGDFGIDIEGSSCRDKLDTDVWTSRCGDGGYIYAEQTMLVTGCLERCGEGQCECPDYVYYAAQGATVNGKGLIDLDQNVDDRRNDHEQELDVFGKGDFTAGMLVMYQIEGCDPVTHAMGAFGTNVGFWASGETDFDENTGHADGHFITMMGFCDPSCPVCTEEPCPPCNPC